MKTKKNKFKHSSKCGSKLKSIKKSMLLEKEVLLLRNAVEMAEKKKKN